MFRTDDTIVAISTAAGNAARAIVRLSGPAAIIIATKVFTPAQGELAQAKGFTAHAGLVRFGDAASSHNPQSAIRNPQSAIELPAIAYLFRSPRSFTRQDVVELHIPGAAIADSSLCAALIEAGARQAEGGEFTARAFFCGRIDLSQAQAVADIINAADAASLRCAVGNLGGNVHRLCQGAASATADALATVEASIDLADEQIQLDSPVAMAQRLAELSANVESAARQAALVGDTADVPQVAVAGRPNAGKSSLVNALCGVDRSIVSNLPGTTRDVLSAMLNLGVNQRVCLLDVAGINQTRRQGEGETRRSTNPSDATISSAADHAARAAIGRADAIVFVIDAASVAPADLDHDLALLSDLRSANPHCPVLIGANKADASNAAAVSALATSLAQRASLPVVATSCVTGAGLDELKARLAECLRMQAWRDGSTLGLHQRQKRCLLLAADAVARAATLLREANEIADVAELVAIELREALSQLGEISGQIINEDILGRIFQRFCVGK